MSLSFFFFYTCVYVWARAGAHVCVLVFYCLMCIDRERPSISPRDAKSGHPRAEWSLCITWWMNELLIPYNVPVAEDYKYQLGKSVCPGWHIRFSTVTKGKIFITHDAQGMRRVCVCGANTGWCVAFITAPAITGLPEILSPLKEKA